MGTRQKEPIFTIFFGLALLAVIVNPFNCFAQQIGTLSLTITDQNGGLIQGPIVRIFDQENIPVESVVIDSSGITVPNLKVGKFRLEIEAPNFKSFSNEIQIIDGINKIDIVLEVDEIIENVEIEIKGKDASLATQSSSFSNFLTPAQLDALPDDPEELEAALKKQFGRDIIVRVDGISGRMPPKSQISSIRITRSSFDAEYHQLGSTVVDIISKAGGNRWLGIASVNFNNGFLNARNPFAPYRAPSSLTKYDLFMSGPIVKNKTSATLILSGRSGTENTDIFAATPVGIVREAINQPTNSFYGWTKFSHNLSNGGSVNVSLNNAYNKAENLGIGGVDLEERGFTSLRKNSTIQFSHSSFIKGEFLNEFRFKFLNERSSFVPISESTTVLVLGSFNSGGSGNRNRFSNSYFELSDNLLWGVREKHALKAGVFFSYGNRKAESEANVNGTFTFSSLSDYLGSMPSKYSRSEGTRESNIAGVQFAAFIQDDIRISKSFLLSAGLRYETQNNLADFNNFSPRLGITWSPLESGKLTFRGGGGIYYQWLETNTISTIYNNGSLQPSETVFLNPGYPDPSSSGNSIVLNKNFWKLDSRVKNPQILMASFSTEATISSKISVRSIYKFERGLHLFRARDINAPFNGIRPNLSVGRVAQIESSSSFYRNSFEVEVNGTLNKKTTFSANYTLSRKKSESDGIFSLPTNNYDLHNDFSYSDDDQRHRIYSAFYWAIRKNLNLATTYSLESGFPFSILTGRDDNGDLNFNDRPLGIARNSERGSWQKSLDMSLAWTLGLRRLQDGESSSSVVVVDAAGGSFSDSRFRFSLKFSLSATNLLNSTNFTSYMGTQTSSLFLQPIAASNPRRVNFALGFYF